MFCVNLVTSTLFFETFDEPPVAGFLDLIESFGLWPTVALLSCFFVGIFALEDDIAERVNVEFRRLQQILDGGRRFFCGETHKALAVQPAAW